MLQGAQRARAEQYAHHGPADKPPGAQRRGPRLLPLPQKGIHIYRHSRATPLMLTHPHIHARARVQPTRHTRERERISLSVRVSRSRAICGLCAAFFSRGRRSHRHFFTGSRFSESLMSTPGYRKNSPSVIKPSPTYFYVHIYARRNSCLYLSGRCIATGAAAAVMSAGCM